MAGLLRQDLVYGLRGLRRSPGFTFTAVAVLSLGIGVNLAEVHIFKAYLMVNLMQDVMNSGTAAGVRSRGFTAPAAGKTGTSRDGWFAGFSSQLVCVVWVGFDDNSELKLEERNPPCRSGRHS